MPHTVLAAGAGFFRVPAASPAGALRLPFAAMAAPALGSTVTPPSRSVCPRVALRLRWPFLASCQTEQQSRCHSDDRLAKHSVAHQLHCCNICYFVSSTPAGHDHILSKDRAGRGGSHGLTRLPARVFAMETLCKEAGMFPTNGFHIGHSNRRCSDSIKALMV